MTKLIPLFLFQLLKGKFYRCFNHKKTNSILGLDELRCCELVLRSTEVQQVLLDSFPHKMRWSCQNCLYVNQADSVTCKSELCPKEAAVSNIEVGSKSQTIGARFDILEEQMNMCPVSLGSPGERDIISASDLVHMLFAPHGVDNSGLLSEAWITSNSTCGCQKTDIDLTKTTGTTEPKDLEPMNIDDDDSASAEGTPMILHSKEDSTESQNPGDQLQQGPSPEVEKVPAPNLTVGLTTEATDPVGEPTLGDGEKVLPLSGSVGIYIKFRSTFHAKRLLEVKFPEHWQTAALSLAESYEIAAVWLELNHRSINDADMARPVWYPVELKTVSKGFLEARHKYLDLKATRSPRNFMRLEAFTLAEANESNRLKRKTNKFRELRDKHAKQAKLDTGEDSSPPDSQPKGFNPQQYRVTPLQFQTAAFEFVRNTAAESTLAERNDLTSRVIAEAKATKQKTPAVKIGPTVPEPKISRPATDSQEEAVKTIDYLRGNPQVPSRGATMSQEKPSAENPHDPSSLSFIYEDKPDGEDVQIEYDGTGEKRLDNRFRYSQNKGGKGTPKTKIRTDNSVEPNQVVIDPEVVLLEDESGTATTHPEKGPSDRSVEGDKHHDLARDLGTSKKTLQRNESVRGGQRSGSKKALSRTKKAEGQKRGTGQIRGGDPAYPAAGTSFQADPYLQSGVCPLLLPGMWRCSIFSCRGRNWPGAQSCSLCGDSSSSYAEGRGGVVHRGFQRGGERGRGRGGHRGRGGYNPTYTDYSSDRADQQHSSSRWNSRGGRGRSYGRPRGRRSNWH